MSSWRCFEDVAKRGIGVGIEYTAADVPSGVEDRTVIKLQALFARTEGDAIFRVQALVP